MEMTQEWLKSNKGYPLPLRMAKELLAEVDRQDNLLHLTNDQVGELTVDNQRLRAHEKATMNVVMLMASYEQRAEDFPTQKKYWNRRIDELDTALKPLLAEPPEGK